MKYVRWFLSLTLSGAGIWFALHGADWPTMKASILSIKSPGWFLLLPFLILFEYTMRSLRWKILLDPLKKTEVKTLLPITTAGFFLNNVLPFRAGELARVYWTRQKTGVSLTSCLAVLAVDRLFDMMSLLTIVFIVLSQKAHLFNSTRPVWIFGSITVAGFAGFILLARFPKLFHRLIAMPWVPLKIKDMLARFIEGAAALQDGRKLILVYAISMIFWFSNITVSMVAAHLFSLPLAWVDSAWLTVGFCFGALLPSAPGYIGTLEAAGVAALSLLGYEKGVSFPFVLVLHFAQIITTVLLGVPSLWIAGLKTGGQSDEPSPAVVSIDNNNESPAVSG